MSINTKETTKELFKNSGIIAIGQVSTKIINFLLLPLYINILSKEEYGLVDVLSSYTSLIVVFVGFQLGAAVFRFMIPSRGDEIRVCKICSTAFLLESVFCFFYFIVFLIIKKYLNMEYEWFLLLHVIVNTYLQFLSSVVRGQGNNKLYSFGNFMSAFVTLVINIIVIAVLRLGVKALLLSYVLGSFVGCNILFWGSGIRKYLGIRFFSKSVLKELISYAAPLIPDELSWSLIRSSDGMIVSYILGVASNGLIAVAGKFSYIYTMLFSIFNASWTEQVIFHYMDEGGQDYICRMYDKILGMFGCLSIGLISIMPFVYDFFVPNKQYSEAYNLIAIYLVAVFFYAAIGMLTPIYSVEKETKKLAVTTAAAALVNIIVDLMLINDIGIYAAPISSLCGYIAITIWRLLDVNKRYFKINMKLWKIALLSFLLAVSLFTYWKTGFLTHFLTLIVTLSGFCIINIDSLKVIVRGLRGRIHR